MTAQRIGGNTKNTSVEGGNREKKRGATTTHLNSKGWSPDPSKTANKKKRVRNVAIKVSPNKPRIFFMWVGNKKDRGQQIRALKWQRRANDTSGLGE